jgi:hypothetical protein
MQFSNELRLPEPLVAAIKQDEYEKGDCEFSVTELIRPPRISVLSRRYGEVMSEDVSDRIFSLIGTAIHIILERAAGDRYITETRFFIDFEGTRVGGRIDLYDKEEMTLQDWKITSRYATKEGPKPEWTAQANLNRYILWKNKIRVENIEYIAILRDWSKMMVARHRADYPEKQVQVLNLPKWTKEEVESYLRERISLHRSAETELPLCSEEERWTKKPKFALMKKGMKRAVRLYDTEEESMSVLKQKIDNAADATKFYIEPRAGEETRCLHYCPVTAYCDFGREVVREASNGLQ